MPVDLDSDGDLDFLMGVIGGSFNPVATAADNFYFWERTAADRLELRTTRLLNGIDLGSETMPALVDLDGDGDLDLVVGNKIDPAQGDAGRLTVFMNDGTAKAPAFRQESVAEAGGRVSPGAGVRRPRRRRRSGHARRHLESGHQVLPQQGTAREANWVEDAGGDNSAAARRVGDAGAG